MAVWTFARIILFCLVIYVGSTEAVAENDVIKRLLKDYEVTVRPNSEDEGQPAKVEINFHARDFYAMDHSMQYIGAQLTFRQKWNDPRLAFNESGIGYLSISNPKLVWVPDLFFSNSRKGRFNDILEPNVLIRIYPNGDVLYSRRVTSDFKCYTDNRMFPFNEISCPVIIASYGFTTDNVILYWKDTSPVQMRRTMEVPPYRISMRDTTYCNSRTLTGEYSCLKSEFILEPNYGAAFYILFLPPLLLVLVGWLTFFLQGRAFKIRISLLVLLLVLGCVCCIHSLSYDPFRLYLTASDAWNGVCLTFLVYALLHFVMTRSVPCLAKACGYDNKDEDLKSQDESQVMIGDDSGETGGMKNKLKKKLLMTARFRHLMTRTGNRADLIARILYPSAFIVANIVYWAIYNQGQ